MNKNYASFFNKSINEIGIGLIPKFIELLNGEISSIKLNKDKNIVFDFIFQFENEEITEYSDYKKFIDLDLMGNRIKKSENEIIWKKSSKNSLIQSPRFHFKKEKDLLTPSDGNKIEKKKRFLNFSNNISSFSYQNINEKQNINSFESEIKKQNSSNLSNNKSIKFLKDTSYSNNSHSNNNISEISSEKNECFIENEIENHIHFLKEGFFHTMESLVNEISKKNKNGKNPPVCVFDSPQTKSFL